MHTRSRSATQQPRGQVLVVACLTMLLLALTLMASFSVSHAIHEKIRIQAAADAQAFSIATLEARGFNTIAYMNRAIAGGIVADLGLHAWRAIASRDVSMYMAGFIAFLMVAAQEFAQCPKFQIQHCIHGIKALVIAFKYNSKRSQAKSALEGQDSKWKQAISDYDEMISNIYKDEKKILDNVKSAINGGLVLQQIKSTSAPNATMENFEDYNTVNLACAVEGSSFDDKCKSLPWKKAPSVLSASERTKVMESAALAARNPVEIGRMQSRSLSASGYHSMDAMPDIGTDTIGMVPSLLMSPPIDPDMSNNPDNMMDVQGNEGSYREMSILSEDISLSNNKISASEPISFVMVQWKHGNGFFITSGDTPSSPYKGVPCNGSGGCFINFRTGQKSQPNSDDTDYSQPATYGGFKQDLRTLGNGGKGAWEIDDKGEVQMVGSDKKMKYVSSNEGYAVSKGKTYFHQLGQNGWEAPPNLFDPFWRAKLHPFLRKELGEALSQLGDSEGQQVANSSGTAIEGVSNK
ncbi:MAG: hypothetical protein U0228_18075 [Myxococcaceae bacterium]